MTKRKFHFADALTPKGWQQDVLIVVDEAGLISEIRGSRSPGDARRFDGFALPGLANVHSHAHQRAMAGLAERSGPGADSFWTWRETMYGFALKMSPDDLQAIAAQAYAEMLQAGFTRVGEFQYLHHQPDGTAYANRAELSLRCVDAARAAGIHMTMLPVLYAHGGFGGVPAGEAQRRFINDVDSFSQVLDILHGALAGRPEDNLGIAPHSLRAVTQEELEQAITVLDDLTSDAPVHIHISEQVKEVEDCIAWSGQRPVEWLLNAFGVDGRWCLIHATHMDEQETIGLACTGATAGLCPTTEANLGDGVFNAVTYANAGGRIAIGSDSHIDISPAHDLRQLEYSQRLRDLKRTVLTGGPHRSNGRFLFDTVLCGGQAAMAQASSGLEVGAPADIVVLDADHPLLIGKTGDDALDAWVFSGGNPCVRDVITSGDQVVEAGRHVRADEILEDYRAAISRLTAME